MDDSSQARSDNRFLAKLGVVVIIASVGVPLLLVLGTLLGAGAFFFAMDTSPPVGTVAVTPGQTQSLTWTEGEFSQELWLEVDIEHGVSPWIYGELVLDGQPMAVDFYGGPVLERATGSLKLGWVDAGSRSHGWVRILEIQPTGAGSEHELTVSLNTSDGSSVSTLRVNLVDCDNWACDPDRPL